MTEPTDRDREMAKEVCRTIRRFDPYRPIPHTFISAKLAEAREEGWREERERCAAIADDQAAKGDEDGDPAVVGACRIAARRIRAGEEPPK